MVGFKIDELMVGSHTFSDGSFDGRELPLNFSITWGSRDILGFFNPRSDEFLNSEARGFITVGGLANKADCEGTLRLMYFSGRKVRYELVFRGDNGRSYSYIGEKLNLWPWNLHRTHLTCYGTISDCETGRIISISVVRFPLREMPDFLMSARLVRT